MISMIISRNFHKAILAGYTGRDTKFTNSSKKLLNFFTQTTLAFEVIEKILTKILNLI